MAGDERVSINYESSDKKRTRRTMTKAEVPFYKRPIPKPVLHVLATLGSLVGVGVSVLALFGIPFGCSLSWAFVIVALVGLLPQVGWWVDKFRFPSLILPIVLVALLLLALAFFWIGTAEPVCEW